MGRLVKVDISFSRNQLVLLSWLIESSLDYLTSFGNFCDVDTSELKDLRDYIDDIYSKSFKLNFKS